MDVKNQAFLLKLSDAMRSLADPVQIMALASEMLGKHLGVGRVGYGEISALNDGEVDATETYLTVARDWTNGVMPSAAGIHRFSDFGEEMNAAFLRGDPFILEDALQAFDDPAVLKNYENTAALRSSLALPLMEQGRAVAGMYVQHSAARKWPQADINLVSEVAERTWAAVERAKAEKALRQSEEKYRTLFDSIDKGFCIVEVILDDNGKPFDLLHLEANKAYELYTGLSGIVGKRSREIIPEAGPWLDFYGHVALTGQAARNETYLVAPIDRWIAASASRIGGEGSLKVAIVFDDITERKRREANLAFLAEISQDLVKMVKPEQTLDILGAKICRYFNTIRSLFAEIIENEQKAIVRDWHRPELRSTAGEVVLSQFVTAFFLV